MEDEIAAIANDGESGASEILRRVVEVLERAMSQPQTVRLRVARTVCLAQPGMAPVWNAALAAAHEDGTRFERFVQRVRRAPEALARLVGELFDDAGAPTARPGVLSLVTLSRSASVEYALASLTRRRVVRVACAEGRPALEGRLLATRLAAVGAVVTLFSDAAIAEALDDADAVVVGADAVASGWILNKVGTRMLAAAAGLTGVPVFVVAGREKFCSDALSRVVIPRDGARQEVWKDAPAPIDVRNPYFERVPLDLIAAIVTDAGVMPAASVPDYCASLDAGATPELVAALTATDADQDTAR